MSLSSSLQIAQLNPDGSVPVPEAPDAAAKAAAQALEQEAQLEGLQAQMESLQEVLNKPLNEILAERDRFKESARAWDAFGAMWLLSQRAMRRVAMELAQAHGVPEADVVSRAITYANLVLNTEEEDLGGTLSAAQLQHIGRHKAALRKQFRQG